MNITVLLWIIILGSSLIIFTRIFNKSASSSELNASEKFLTAKIKNHEYKLKVADTDEKRSRGLMEIASMPENQGMLFIFDVTGIYPFWMKNTLIPLDMLWINSDKIVVHIKQNAQPCSNIVTAVCESAVPLKAAKYVVELNAGQVEKNGIKVGDKIEF